MFAVNLLLVCIVCVNQLPVFVQSQKRGLQRSYNPKFRSLIGKIGPPGLILPPYPCLRRPYWFYGPCPPIDIPIETCPTLKSQIEIVSRNVKSSARSRRSPGRTVSQYNTQASVRNFLAIGNKQTKKGWSGSVYVPKKGSVCDKNKCYRPLAKGQKCPGVDLTFIMDCSGSIDASEWKLLTKFVKDSASIFDVSLKSTRTAAINFGSDACVQFNLGTHTTNEQFYAAVDKIPNCGGATHLAKALDLATDNIFNKKYLFDRPDVLNICLVFTDGQANGPGNVRKAADRLREAGCEVYAVSIGNNVDNNQLLTVAGGDNNKVINADDFQSLLKKSVLCTIQ